MRIEPDGEGRGELVSVGVVALAAPRTPNISVQLPAPRASLPSARRLCSPLPGAGGRSSARLEGRRLDGGVGDRRCPWTGGSGSVHLAGLAPIAVGPAESSSSCTGGEEPKRQEEKMQTV